MHATYYRTHGRREEMTVSAIVRRCEELGLDALGAVEHLNESPEHPIECLRALAEEARGVSSGLALFVGAELDVLDERGTVTASEEVKRELGLDYFLAAVHGLVSDVSSVEEFVERNHRVLMGVAVNCRFADVLAHPWCVGHSLEARGIDGWSFERLPETRQDELIAALAENKKAFELNARARQDFADPAYREFILKLRDAGVKLAVGSDSHSMEKLDASECIGGFLEEMDFPAGQIWTPEREE